MESAPPLNLSTTVKVEDLQAMVPEEAPQEYTVEGEVVSEAGTTVDEEVNPLGTDDEDNVKDGANDLEEDTKENLTSDDTLLDSKIDPNAEEKEYKCSECQAEFVRASQLRAHARTHFEEQMYECDQCEEVFVRIGLLTTHQREQHRHSFACNDCDAKFSHYNSYKLHQRRHKGDKPHKCKDCNMAFVQQCHLSIHRRIHTGEKPYKCELCPQKFKQASHLTTHRRVHTNDKPFACNHCEASFSQTSSLKRHKRRHTGEKPFKCDECGALFVERRNLSRHQLTHTGEKPYKCEKCPASFTQMIDLKRHQMSHSGLKPFKCDVCDAAFSRKNNLRWHKLTHEGDTPFKCDRCNVGFSLQRDMKTHMRTHSGSKPFSCDQCGATFTQFSTLKRHRQSHTGERHFVCSKCHGAFKDRSALKRHMLRHESVRPFSCHKCDSTFIEYRNLKRHRVTVHGEERFEGQDGMDARDNESGHTPTPPKKRSSKVEEDDENTLSPMYDASYGGTPLTQQQESTPHQQHVDQPITLAPVTNLPQSQHQPHTTQTVQTNAQPPMVNEIVTIPAQAPGQLPTLLLTQPGQATKTARPANNCQNHQSHVLTFVEGSYNHWQSWCFCETPNIPDNQQAILDNGSSVGGQPPSSTISPAAVPQHQAITYTELQQTQPQPQSVGVQEVDQTEYHQSSQFSAGYSESLHHYEDSHHADQLEPLTTHHHHHSHHHQSQHLHQPHTSQEDIKIAIDSPRLYSVPGIQDSEQQGPQQQQSQPQQQHHDQHSQHHQQQQQQHHLQPQTDQQQDHPDHHQQQVDPQVTFQYSLTVNNPATGDIQIQSEAFPANPPDPLTDPPADHPAEPPADPPIKKRRLTKATEPQDVKSYNCDSCPKIFSRINHLLIHQRTHTGEKPFQCGVCYQSFTHKNSLTIHMRGHTGERPYVCSTCGASFTQKSNLRVHSRTHTGEKPFKCDVCSLAFTQGSHLTAHKRIHNNDRPFACESCLQTFTQRSALKRHLMTHTGHKPHKCEDCNARFSQRDDLRRHQRVHSGEKPLPSTCGLCNVPFPDKTALTRHVRSVHQADQSVDGTRKKKKKSSIKQTTDEENTSPKSSKMKSKVAIPEPTRTSKRLREAAEKKKEKTDESDFIMGDFVDIEDIKPPLRQKPVKKPDKLGDIKSEAKSKMESWCFCEVPHGPDEPHTHSAADTKSRNEDPTTILPGIDESTKQGATNLIATADVTGATSLLQLSMEHVSHNSGTSAVVEGNMQGQSIDNNVPLNTSPAIVGTSQVGETSGMSESSNQQVHVTSVGQTDPSISHSLASGQVVTAIGQPSVSSQTSGRLVGQSMLTAGQVMSTGQLVGASQLMTQEGTIFIEAGEMLGNGTVVINPAQGTFISYDQITISPDGQVLGVPVGSGGAETLMIQSAPVSVDSAASSSGGNYSSGATIQESNSTQPVQYTALGSDVISLFSQVEANKESTSSDLSSDKILPVVAKPLDCSVCAKSFAQKRTLWTHMQDAHPELYSCAECCAAFTTSEYLTQHKTQHQKVHVCTKCGLAFTNKSSLNRHRQHMHSGASLAIEDKVFACEICDARFHQQSDLRRHMLGHTGEKPYRCKHCEAGFTRTSSLNKHMRIHTGEKPYVCEECEQAFSYRYQFNRHKASHRQDDQRGNYSMPFVYAE